VGGAGELGDEEHFVTDVSEVGVEVFGQQVAIRDKQRVGGVHWVFSMG
jgi:hypothetical protein